jgi:hypothetical protein
VEAPTVLSLLLFRINGQNILIKLCGTGGSLDFQNVGVDTRLGAGFEFKRAEGDKSELKKCKYRWTDVRTVLTGEGQYSRFLAYNARVDNCVSRTIKNKKVANVLVVTHTSASILQMEDPRILHTVLISLFLFNKTVPTFKC